MDCNCSGLERSSIQMQSIRSKVLDSESVCSCMLSLQLDLQNFDRAGSSKQFSWPRTHLMPINQQFSIHHNDPWR